ncbi:MAG: adenosylcobinamide-GDP ribazoletransferase [Magnetococcales bacterium]|nr:adenosylcobinamide-GDP ribazoletransferase [Magnetococcales bacterium]
MTAVGRAWNLALGLLTRLPTAAVPTPVSGVDLGRSVLFYPLAGLLVGVGMVGVAMATHFAGVVMQSALVLVAWVALTGALHLDGLADWADAAVGGMGSRQRTLEIMKDPRSGPAAITVLTLLLILKWAALQTFLQQNFSSWWLLAVVPALGRAVLVALFRTTPYANPHGMAAEAAQHFPQMTANWVLLLIALLTTAIQPFPLGLLLLIVAGATFVVMRRIFMQRVQGFTGDMAGALCETTETTLLILLAWWSAIHPSICLPQV